jgi:hypothetical protein
VLAERARSPLPGRLPGELAHGRRQAPGCRRHSLRERSARPASFRSFAARSFRDTRIFVNYLDDLPYTVDEERDTIEPLEEHRGRIPEWLAIYGQDERVGPKYRWMASFHNWVLQRSLPPQLATPLLGRGRSGCDLHRDRRLMVSEECLRPNCGPHRAAREKECARGGRSGRPVAPALRRSIR